MLSIRLIVIEDERSDLVYEQLRTALQEWIFIKKGIITLFEEENNEWPKVISLEDWREKLSHLGGKDQLVFCTVDLKIPERVGQPADYNNGLAVLNDIKARQHDGLRCCVLTGMTSDELGKSLGEKNIPDALFEFKGEMGNEQESVAEFGYKNIINFIKSQCFSMMDCLDFQGDDQRAHRVLLHEASGKIREHYLSKASYYADAPTWHVPTLIVGERGLGHKTLIEFIAYLANATYEVVDLGFTSEDTPMDKKRRNRKNFRVLEKVRLSLEQDVIKDRTEKRLYFVPGLDKYQPENDCDEGMNCIWALNGILDSLGKLGSTQEPGFPICFIFSVSAQNRLKIHSPQTRNFIRHLEEKIAAMTDFPLHHLGLDENGWTLAHPRIVRVPNLKEHGKDFIPRFLNAQLEKLRQTLKERIPGYRGQQLSLSPELEDFLIDGTNWSQMGNLFGLRKCLNTIFNNFLEKNKRAADQYTLTLAHLDKSSLERFHNIILNMNDVRLSFPQPDGSVLNVVDKADLKLNKDELLVILGLSGCGKSTILKMLSGLLKPTEGEIFFRNQKLTQPTKKIGFIFQDYSLFPWLTVRENIGFGPNLNGARSSEIERDIDELLEIARLDKKQEDAYPRQLSGGMQQRVAIVRSLANKPDVLLMDEPFSALDIKTRWSMQEFLVDTKGRTHKSIVFVTHDIDEAVFVGERILICSPRPLKLVGEYRVPFSSRERTPKLRRDPVFVALADQVRDALLAAAGD